MRTWAPAPYVLMVKDYGLKPLLVKLQLNGSYKYTGLIITRKDSDI
ncbi:PhnD/SsuA/transferrin family substrate-binding protein [Candidatus Reidiella endopervernicosa]